MVKLVMTRRGDMLYCANPAEADALSKMPQNCDLNCVVTKARSVRQNNTYWGMLEWIIKDGPEWIGNEWSKQTALSDVIQIDLGYTRIFTLLDGTQQAFPKSKDFEKMPQEEFNEYFQEALAKLTEMCGYCPLEAYKNYMENKG